MSSFGKVVYTDVKLSENIEQTKEGYLKCKNAIFGGVGIQEYFGSEFSNREELGLDSDKIYEVHRTEEEVSRKDFLESAEGKPLTLNHPNEMVDIDNIKYHDKGSIIGTPRYENGEIIGTLLIKDKEIKDLILNGLRGLSLGYEADVDVKNGKLYQKNMKVNHIALLKNPRYKNALVLDSGEKLKEKENKMSKEILEMFEKLNDSLENIKKELGSKEYEEKEEVKEEIEVKDEDKVEIKETKEKEIKDENKKEIIKETKEKEVKDEDKVEIKEKKEVKEKFGDSAFDRVQMVDIYGKERKKGGRTMTKNDYLNKHYAQINRASSFYDSKEEADRKRNRLLNFRPTINNLKGDE